MKGRSHKLLTSFSTPDSPSRRQCRDDHGIPCRFQSGNGPGAEGKTLVTAKLYSLQLLPHPEHRLLLLGGVSSLGLGLSAQLYCQYNSLLANDWPSGERIPHRRSQILVCHSTPHPTPHRHPSQYPRRTSLSPQTAFDKDERNAHLLATVLPLLPELPGGLLDLGGEAGLYCQ